MNPIPDSKIRFTLPALPIILGLSALIGWTLDIDFLKRGIAASVPMNPTTAVGFILLGLEAARLHTKNTIFFINRAGQWAIWLVIIAGTLKLCDLILGTSFHIDAYLFAAKLATEPGQPSRMAPNTALCFIMLGWSMLLLRKRSNLSILTAQLLSVVAILFALLAIIGYAYGISSFYVISIFSPMAINTAVAFLFLSSAALLAHPNKGFMCALTHSGSPCSIVLSATVLVPFIFGLISLAGHHAGLYDMQFALALSVVLNIAILFLLCYISLRKSFLSDTYQKKITAELRNSATTLRAILENSPFVVWLKDPQGRYITINKALLNYIGLQDIGQVVGKTDLDFFPKELAEKYRADDAEIMATRRQKHIEEQAWDGERMHWVETYKTSVIDEQGNILGTTGFALDITERKRMEESLKNMVVKYHTVFELSSDAIMLLNGKGFFDCNEATLRMFGCPTRDGFISKHPAELSPPTQPGGEDSMSLAKERIATAFKNGSNRFEWMHRRLDGVEFPAEVLLTAMELDGKPSLQAVVRDITERKQVEQKTQALALRNQVLMQTATDGIHVMDEQGNIVEANDAFCRLLGYTAEEIMHLNVADWDVQWTAEELRVLFKESIGHGTIIETVHRRKDGTHCNVEISTSNVELDGQHYFFAASRDITARKQAEEELRIAAIAFDSQQGMILTDINGIILRVNQAFTRLTGYSAIDAIGKTPRLLSSGRQTQAFYQDMWANLLEKRYWQGEIWNRRKNGMIYAEWLSISAVPDVEGQVTHYIGAFSEITQYKEAEAEIHRLAYYDPLTQLPNRRLLNDRLSQALAASVRSGKYGALLFIDLDNFKILNDTLGHDMGDVLLKQVAQRLVTCVREGDTVAREGGDEFVVILKDLSDSSGEAATLAEIIGEKVLTTLNDTYQLASHDYHSTTSIGVTLFIGHLNSIEELLKRADIAMYQAKTSGRNAIRFFDPAMQAVVTARAALDADLRRALAKNQFKLYFQMQVHHDRRIIGAEVLLRWLHPERGLVAPLEFIPLAEETGLIIPIGQWVLETACTQLKIWENTTVTQHLQLAVNVSARQFHQADFVEQVCTVLEKTAIKPGRLKLELTESLVLDNIDDTISKMQALKKIGVRFSMDDFGTGYSSLAYLTQLPLDQLKIDQSFVRNIGVKPTDAIIVQTIIGMADNLGIEVIAEGVETEAQRAFLELHGCLACQGYLFGRPVPLAEFESSLSRAVL